MGKITYLKIKARLENVEELKPNPDHSFALKLKCSACGEISDKWHDVNESDKFPGRTGRSEHHYVGKCKMCGRDNTLDIVQGSIASYRNEDSENFKSIISFEGRGLEVVDYQPGDNWCVKVDGSSKIFSDVDLSEKEWVEYDEKIQDSVGVYDLEHLIE
ncbi:CXXC motif containing zinc binding protein [Anthonomus grandis grandis]|uniref:CXXC motif containing zinc binding protein n=1 Tax=Anthonomus grandis grandis TaxID=2921223 RepID=UPI00216594D9|nr:CXXC motif containing zinc binding protein [Anthonomus grandis grandis]